MPKRVWGFRFVITITDLLTRFGLKQMQESSLDAFLEWQTEQSINPDLESDINDVYEQR